MKVFVSHSTKDKWAARRIAEDLEGLGSTVFLDEKDIATGESIDQAIRSHLSGSDHFLLLLSPASISSEWVLLELGGALALGKTIVPILLHVGANELPKAISLKLARDINEIDRYYDEIRGLIGVTAKPTRRARKAIPKPPGGDTFKTGDRVRIVPQRPSTAYSDEGLDFYWVEAMDRYLGQIATITKAIGAKAYELDVDQAKFGWSEEWLLKPPA